MLSGSTNFYSNVTTMISGYLPLPPCLATGFLCLMLQTAAPTHKKIKCLYYKHVRCTVPQNRIPTAMCTSKHAVLIIVCHSSSHDSNWNSKPKTDLQWLPWKHTTFHIYSGCVPFFPIIFNTQSWEDIIWIILQTLLWSRAIFFPLYILQNFCSCCSKYM